MSVFAKIHAPQPEPLLSYLDEEKIRTWLNAIGETDRELIEDTISRCREDKEVRDYFVGRSLA